MIDIKIGDSFKIEGSEFIYTVTGVDHSDAVVHSTVDVGGAAQTSLKLFNIGAAYLVDPIKTNKMSGKLGL